MAGKVKTPGMARKYARAAGVALLVIGFLGFLGIAIAAVGGSKWFARDFEWPAAISAGVVHIDGYYYVPHVSSRVQVYDEEWNFMHSFYVPSDGGVFAIGKGVNETIVVHTARGNYVLHYARSGELLKQRQYDYAYMDTGATVVVPTPWYLWPISHPIGFWLMAALGLLIDTALDKKRK